VYGSRCIILAPTFPRLSGTTSRHCTQAGVVPRLLRINSRHFDEYVDRGFDNRGINLVSLFSCKIKLPVSCSLLRPESIRDKLQCQRHPFGEKNPQRGRQKKQAVESKRQNSPPPHAVENHFSTLYPSRGNAGMFSANLLFF
jgi:hypothetical protein